MLRTVHFNLPTFSSVSNILLCFVVYEIFLFAAAGTMHGIMVV